MIRASAVSGSNRPRSARARITRVILLQGISETLRSPNRHTAICVQIDYLDAAMTPHACMMYGQSEIAKWSEGNPNWALKRWTCGRPSQLAKA